MAVTTAFVTVRAPEPPPVARDNFQLFPRALGDWQGRQFQLASDVERVLGADDYINATYISPNQTQAVNFFSAFYHKQTEGSGIHSPEVCLPVGGWEIFTFDTHEVSFPETIYGTFELNRAVIQKGLEKQLVYYWFEQRGRRMTNDFSAKMTVLYDGFTMGRSDGAIVRYTTVIGQNESEQDAEARIESLMAETLPRLQRFIPDGPGGAS